VGEHPIATEVASLTSDDQETLVRGIAARFGTDASKHAGNDLEHRQRDRYAASRHEQAELSTPQTH
jgi:hypothetical protein